MRYPNYPGTGKRIADRLEALGYVTLDGRLDIARFIREKHYDPRSFYPWIKGRTPSGENLRRLAQDLEVSPGYLLFGAELSRPIGGGSAIASTAGSAEALPLADAWEAVSLIGRWIKRLFSLWAPPLQQHGAFA